MKRTRLEILLILLITIQSNLLNGQTTWTSSNSNLSTVDWTANSAYATKIYIKKPNSTYTKALHTGSDGWLYIGDDLPIYLIKSIHVSDGNDIRPYTDKGANLGTSSRYWGFLYTDNGYFNNVGIGTTSPDDKLQVVSTNHNDIFSIRRNNATQGNTFDFRITSNPNGGSSLNDRSLSIIPTEYDSDIALYTSVMDLHPAMMLLKGSGNVGIGTTNPTEKLAVNGTIKAKEVKVETNWSDFVFEDDYKLQSLNEVESFIKENKHLPDIPSKAEVKENGVSLGEMDAKLLQKIEELTLYIINQEKRIKELEMK
jgi:hypothetical protein